MDRIVLPCDLTAGLCPNQAIRVEFPKSSTSKVGNWEQMSKSLDCNAMELV